MMNTKNNIIEGDKTKKQIITQGKTTSDSNIIIKTKKNIRDGNRRKNQRITQGKTEREGK